VTTELGNTVNANRAPKLQQLHIATDGLRPFQVMP
jgi:hypothetical protein